MWFGRQSAYGLKAVQGQGVGADVRRIAALGAAAAELAPTRGNSSRRKESLTPFSS